MSRAGRVALTIFHTPRIHFRRNKFTKKHFRRKQSIFSSPRFESFQFRPFLPVPARIASAIVSTLKRKDPARRFMANRCQVIHRAHSQFAFRAFAPVIKSRARFRRTRSRPSTSFQSFRCFFLLFNELSEYVGVRRSWLALNVLFVRHVSTRVHLTNRVAHAGGCNSAPARL